MPLVRAIFQTSRGIAEDEDPRREERGTVEVLKIPLAGYCGPTVREYSGSLGKYGRAARCGATFRRLQARMRGRERRQCTY